MKKGPGWKNSRKRKAPLRDVVRVLSFPVGIFSTYRVVLECGHEVSSWSDNRARCLLCLDGAPSPDEKEGT